GVATAGIPYACILAHITEKPLVYVRFSNKNHDRQNIFEGAYIPRQRGIVVENLIFTGWRYLHAVEQLPSVGLEVTGVIAIFSYELQKAMENFGNMNIKYKSLSNYNDLIQQAVEMKYVSEEDLSILAAWNSSPQNWRNA